MIRVAAVGDIHMGPDTRGALRPAFESLPECADVLLLAGDLTRHGTLEEARAVAGEVRDLPVPVVAVLGNHDHHDERPDEVAAVLEDSGARVLEGSVRELRLHLGVLVRGELDGQPAEGALARVNAVA
ncbi:metallophosphoesterase family protein, partial [Streptomyces sp. NPDC001215]